MDSVLKNIKKLAKNNYAFSLSDKNNPYVVKSYIDTGCYVLNAVVGNGDIFSGMPMGKRITLAGATSTAKSFFGAHMIKSFLSEVENSYAIFFESEGSTISEMATNLDIPADRMIILPVMTVEEFKIQSVSILDGILEERTKEKTDNKLLIDKNNKDRKKAKKDGIEFIETPQPVAPKYILCLDSIGMLASEKEVKDAQDGKNTVDMTRAKAVKSVFRLITMKLSLTETTLITIAHSYQTMEMFSKAVVSGGTGLGYASDVVLILSKAKQKEGTDHIGANITCNVSKSRYIPEGQKVKVQILFKKGMSKYSSLVDMAYEYNIFKKDGNNFILPDETKVSMKEVRSKPEEYILPFLDQIRDEIFNRFSFDSDHEEINIDADINESDNEDEPNEE